MITTAKILDYDGENLLIKPTTVIDRELLQKQVEVIEIRLQDGREISAEQRRKIFALIRDISIWSGHEPEYIRQHTEFDYRMQNGIEPFSLSDCDMSTAREYITYLINFCFDFNVPTRDTLLNQTDDIDKYLYSCIEHRKCAICNNPAEIHHVDVVGMGGNRKKMSHIGYRAIALCPIHHREAHTREKEFFEAYHVYGIKLDAYLCRVLGWKGETND